MGGATKHSLPPITQTDTHMCIYHLPRYKHNHPQRSPNHKTKHRHKRIYISIPPGGLGIPPNVCLLGLGVWLPAHSQCSLTLRDQFATLPASNIAANNSKQVLTTASGRFLSDPPISFGDGWVSLFVMPRFGGISFRVA